MRFYHTKLGWSFTPLNGKRPTRPGWQKAKRESLEDVERWRKAGNIGLRTGRISGIVVIDIDPGGDISKLNLPETVTVKTGRGGLHLYYSTGRMVRNSSGKLGPHIDVRGEGGQVVFPGSVHPETGKKYEWIKSPEDIEVAELPDEIFELLKSKKVPGGSYERERKNIDKYIESVLNGEISNVMAAKQGTRNDTLNKAAYSLGQLVGGGYISEEEARKSLFMGGKSCGLDEDEIWRTVESGMMAGQANPRKIKQRTKTPDPVPDGDGSEEYILAPGPHVTNLGEYVEQSNASFAEEIVANIPRDTIYRKTNLPGEIVGAPGKRHWEELKTDRVRLISDTFVKIGSWQSRKKDSALIYRPCTRDMGGIILAGLQKDPAVRELNLLVSYPVYGPDFEILSPGWHEGLYYDEPGTLRKLNPILDIEIIRETLDELVVDFPFRDESSRQNFFGLMLTPIIAPAVNGNRPLHLLIASLERTGKTKLAEEVFGGVILGRQTPAMQITDRDEERDKRLLALLLLGETIVHLDNLPVKVDSAALASMLTATNYQGRMLGSSRILSLPNNLTVVGSGNNIECSGEIIKRSIPIILQPKTSKPEGRKGFKHPNLVEHVRKSRKKVLECLLGMVELWKSQGKPLSDKRMGGFESWSEIVGGIMGVAGFNKWRTNEEAWRVESNPEALDMEAFIEKWRENFKDHAASASELLTLAKELQVFEHLYVNKNRRGQLAAFGNFLRQKRNTPVGKFVINRTRMGDGYRYNLIRQKGVKNG